MADARQELRALTERSARLMTEGFSLDVATEREAWDRCLKALERGAAYAAVAETLCGLYEQRYGEPFLFSDACVAYEVRYHVEAYLDAVGFPGYRPHLSTRLFDRESLIRHTKEVDISTRDVGDAKQRLMFGYRTGIRDCWRGTEKDPFR